MDKGFDFFVWNLESKIENTVLADNVGSEKLTEVSRPGIRSAELYIFQ